MTTDSHDESKYDPVVIEPQTCPHAIRLIAVGMITLGVMYGLLFLINSNRVSQDEVVTRLSIVSFVACLSHLYAATWLARLDNFARWLALVNVAADCGLAGIWVFATVIYLVLPARLHLTDILGHPDFGYVLALWTVMLLLFTAAFLALTHPNTVRAFEQE
jgi:hypothetical protein